MATSTYGPTHRNLILENGEPLIPLTKATKIPWLPKHRGHADPHVSTLLRHVIKGLKVGSHVIKLEAVRAGSGWCTSEAAIRRFYARLTDPGMSVGIMPPEAQMQRDHKAAVAQLQAANFGGDPRSHPREPPTATPPKVA